jgi:ABC-type transport system involved in cytochrome c biogenesis permease subunit
MLFALAGGVCRAEQGGDLDWNTWRHMPAFGEGRVVPVDTFARETVEAICGRVDPTLVLGDAPPRKFSAAELLLSWLVEPEKWENASFLVAADESLRKDVLRLPLRDENGRRLYYASPVEVENSAELGRRWTELQKQAEAAGQGFRPGGVEKKMKALVEAYEKFRLFSFNPLAPKDTPRRFYARVRSAAAAWRKLAGDLEGAKRISRNDAIRQLMVRSGESLQKLIGAMHGHDFAREKVEPLVEVFCRTADQLAARLTDAADKPLSALAADLRRQTTEMHLALYDNGETLRPVPALNAGALEENRTPGDDAAPWLSVQALLFGSPDLLRSYPQPALKAVGKAFAEVKAAYLNRGVADRPAKFSAAMDRFAEAVRTLAEQIEPLRAKLPIQHSDRELIAVTAYPSPGSTDAEVFYNRFDPFFWSWVVSLAATLCLLLAIGPVRRSMFWIGVMLLLVAQAFTAAGLGLRGYVTGLVPLTGMFETVVFVALYAALLGLWFALLPLWWPSGHRPAYRGGDARMDRVFERRLFAVAGAIVSFLAAVLAYYAPSTVMHRNLGAVAPILRDNFWLAVHVVTIMTGYASAAIALILGNMALGYYLLGRYVIQPVSNPQMSGTAEGGRTTRRPPDACAMLAGFTYTAIQITVLLLTAGTILGALWADKAWGRFWAWDPKEVWALISLLAYLGFLHMRHVGWLGAFGMAMTAVLGASAVGFTWYGVNFLLGSGMHSYGSGAGGQWQVGTAAAIQLLFLAAAAGRYLVETEGSGARDQGPEI